MVMNADIKFHEIEISRFRGFDYIKLENLTNVNVFVGANNVGKSSVLEAIFMLVGMANPLMPTRINFWRASAIADLGRTRYLFHNLDLKNPPILKASGPNEFRRLTFNPFMLNDANASSDLVSTRIGQFDFHFDTKEEGEYSYHTSLYLDNANNLQQRLDLNYREDISCLFIPADKNDSNAAGAFAVLVMRNKKQVVVDALQKFDADIENIEALPDGLYLKIKGMTELLPIGMAGDGVRRLINILSSIACEDYQIVLIDEIDTGLHYKAHKLMWTVLLDFIKDRNIQLFTTTHNLECIESLDSVVDSDDSLKPLVGVYNITKTKNEGFQAYRYSASELRESIKNEIEIR